MTQEYNDIKNFVDGRNKEIEIMLKFCERCKVEEAVLIKSSIILVTYNLIEGCFSRLNNEIFDYIYTENIDIFALNEELQKVYFGYYLANVKNASDLKAFYKNKNITEVLYKDICDKVHLFSGNLDAKHIRDFSKRKIGVKNIVTRHGQKLLDVKSLRNKLAHGEIAFSEATRDITLNELKYIIEDVVKFMYVVIERYDEFFQTIGKSKD